MRITEEALNEFIKIYNKECGEELNRSEASKMASRVVALYELLAKKLSDENAKPPKNEHPPIGFRR